MLGTVAVALAVACVVLVAEQGRVVMESGMNMRAKENAFFDMLAGAPSSQAGRYLALPQVGLPLLDPWIWGGGVAASSSVSSVSVVLGSPLW